MHFNVLNRKVHYWASAIIALPMLVMICSGLLLQSKKHWSWVQPPEQRGTGKHPVLSLEQILHSVKQVSDLGVTSWNDVNRLDVRPSRGMVKVRLMSGHEVQVDLGTGAVLQIVVVQRSVDVLGALLGETPARRRKTQRDRAYRSVHLSF